MDEYGYVIDLELAKAIIIEFFSTGEYKYDGYKENYKEFYGKIKSELIYNGDYFTFEYETGTYFGGPEGDSGLWIQELSEWIKEYKEYDSTNGLVSALNNERKVFYEVNGELKCFIIHEGD